MVPGDERVNFKKALNNYIVQSKDREYVDYIQNRVRFQKSNISFHARSKYIKYCIIIWVFNQAACNKLL